MDITSLLLLGLAALGIISSNSCGNDRNGCAAAAEGA